VKRGLQLAERLAWVLGALLLLVYGLVRMEGMLGRRRELGRFQEARAKIAAAAPAAREFPPDREPDQRLWSKERIRKYRESRRNSVVTPLAILRIPKIDLEVPVLDGTDDRTLNRAVGRIEHTAAPGEPGNCGIAGHRDGFFRRLKDIGPGDRIELQTLRVTEHYVVSRVRIVAPEDVSVLDPTPMPVVTLVTCYPFNYIGSAPRRYIVRAVPVPAGSSGS
jgi:sortase A